MKENPNLTEVFGKIKEQYGAEEALRRLAYWDSFLEGQLIGEFNKSLGTRSVVNALDVINELKIQRLKRLPMLITNQPAPERGVCKASPFTLGYFIDWLLVDEKYPAEELADRLYSCCSDLYKRDGMFLLPIYNGCYDLLIGLIPK